MPWLPSRFSQTSPRFSPDGSQIWLNYALRRNDGVYVGWIQATIAGDVATIGYDVFPDFWRQGYGSEACGQLVRALCTEAAVRRVVATVEAAAAEVGLLRVAVIDSPITGAHGNREFLMHLRCASA